MLKHPKIFFSICLLILLQAAQLSSQTLYKEIPGAVDYFTTDNLGNLYTVKNNEIVKYNPKGEYFARYSNKNYGKITFADVSNPLKVILVYKDFSQILILDNMLSETSNGIKLEDLQLEQATLACSSFNNGLWIYNAISFELRRVNENFAQTNQTLNINQLVNDYQHPESMLEQSGFLYLVNPNLGILVFDNFGTYIRTIPILGLHAIQVKDRFIYYFMKDKLYYYKPETFETEEIPLPEKDLISVRVEKGKMFLQTALGIRIYNIE